MIFLSIPPNLHIKKVKAEAINQLTTATAGELLKKDALKRKLFINSSWLFMPPESGNRTIQRVIENAQRTVQKIYAGSLFSVLTIRSSGVLNEMRRA
jgi:hypothetical protein